MPEKHETPASLVQKLDLRRMQLSKGGKTSTRDLIRRWEGAQESQEVLAYEDTPRHFANPSRLEDDAKIKPLTQAEVSTLGLWQTLPPSQGLLQKLLEAEQEGRRVSTSSSGSSIAACRTFSEHVKASAFSGARACALLLGFLASACSLVLGSALGGGAGSLAAPLSLGISVPLGASCGGAVAASWGAAFGLTMGAGTGAAAGICVAVVSRWLRMEPLRQPVPLLLRPLVGAACGSSDFWTLLALAVASVLAGLAMAALGAVAGLVLCSALGLFLGFLLAPITLGLSIVAGPIVGAVSGSAVGAAAGAMFGLSLGAAVGAAALVGPSLLAPCARYLGCLRGFLHSLAGFAWEVCAASPSKTQGARAAESKGLKSSL